MIAALESVQSLEKFIDRAIFEIIQVWLLDLDANF
jgi:hypothetical protein